MVMPLTSTTWTIAEPSAASSRLIQLSRSTTLRFSSVTGSGVCTPLDIFTGGGCCASSICLCECSLPSAFRKARARAPRALRGAA